MIKSVKIAVKKPSVFYKLTEGFLVITNYLVGCMLPQRNQQKFQGN